MVTLCCHSSPHMASDSTTQKAYIECVEERELSWIEGVTTRWPDIWQKESASCCTSKRIQHWLSENFSNHITAHICLSNSPDYNLLYYLWCMVEQETNKTRCNTKIELKARITAAFINLNKETIRKGCRSFKVIWRLWLKPKAISLTAIIYCISRYLYVILVNTSDKGEKSVLFLFCEIETIYRLHPVCIYIYIYIYIYILHTHTYNNKTRSILLPPIPNFLVI